MSFFRILFVSWFFAVLAVAVSPDASAFSIQPALKEISMNPGDEYQGVLTIMNDDRIPQNFRISIQKFMPQGEFGQQTFLPEDDRRGLPEWIHIDRQTLRLEPNARSTVRWKMTVPQNILPGGYYAAIFTTASMDGVSNEFMPLAARIGMLLFVRVNGNVKPHFSFSDFYVAERSLSRLPVTMTALITNDGNVHGSPEGKIEIRNIWGKITTRMDLNPDGGRVLPDSKRRIQSVWQERQPKTGNGFWYEAAEEWRNFGLGPYTITATMASVSPDQAQIRVEKVKIWPFRLVFLAFFLLVLIVVTFYGYGRAVLKRATMR